jgi:outer membrane protein TolC
VEAFRLGFEGQADGLVDVLDARRDLAETEIDRTQTLVEYRQTLAELEYLVGQHLVPTD